MDWLVGVGYSGSWIDDWRTWEGAKDSRGTLFQPTIRELSQQGVEFRVCSNTLRQRGIDPATLVPQATRVPAGVAEIARLQAREGYAYLRP